MKINSLEDVQYVLDQMARNMVEMAEGLVKPGDMIFVGGVAVREGFLLCDNALLLRATYPRLFAAIGTAHNVGGESALQFRLPDLTGRVPMGAGTPAGAAGATAHPVGQRGGEEKHALSGSESGTNGNGGTTNQNALHTHGGATDGMDRSIDHLHSSANGQSFMTTIIDPVYAWSITGAGGASYGTGRTSTTGASDRSLDHAHGFTTATESAYHQHPLNDRGADTAHNNLSPFTTGTWLIRV